MLTSDGNIAFVNNSSRIKSLKYDAKSNEWLPYGAHFQSGAIKDGTVVKTAENTIIGFAASKIGNVVIAHDMGTFNVCVYKFNKKTGVWRKIQTLVNVEYSDFVI